MENFNDVEFDLHDQNGLVDGLVRYLAGAIATGLFREDELRPIEVEMYGPAAGTNKATAFIVDVTIADGMFDHAILNWIDSESGTSYFLGVTSDGKGTFAVQERVVVEKLDDEPAFRELPAASRAALFYD